MCSDAHSITLMQGRYFICGNLNLEKIFTSKLESQPLILNIANQ